MPATHERAEQVEQHAAEVGQQSEHRDDHVFEPVEHVVLAEGHDGHDAGRHVEQERAEVADQRDDQQRVGQLRVGVRREDAEAVPEVVLVQRRQVPCFGRPDRRR